MPEGNLLGRIAALAIVIAAVVWIGRFTGAVSPFCSMCEPKTSAAPAATETQEAAPAPKAAPAAAPKSTGTTPSSPKTEKK